MKDYFAIHNRHHQSITEFAEHDPQLKRLRDKCYAYESLLLQQFNALPCGIYTLGGGRQIGKTTLLKQWMLQLLQQNTDPNAIVFLTGELIDNHHMLLHLLQDRFAQMPTNLTRYILIDEIAYIKDWDKTIKYLADAGLLENTVLMLTGSDLTLIQEARMRFPGRRGGATTVDFHLYPLSFRECFAMKYPKIFIELINQSFPSESQLKNLFAEWDNYLRHGGFLTAINEFYKNNTISLSTLKTYSDWICGDVLKRGKQAHYLMEIMQAIVKRYGCQVSWNALAKDLSIDHPKTVSDYVDLLSRMDAVFVQAALIEDKRIAAPKKARKLMFCDPFIFHAVRAWIFPVADPFQDQINMLFSDPILLSQLVETTAITQYRRYYPTYYIKAEGEVDIAYVNENTFFPIEIKWTTQQRAKDLRQILKYKNAKIFSKTMQLSTCQQVPVIPLPWAMLFV